MNTAFVYGIIHTATGDAYVGSSINIVPRWKRHQYELRKQRHHSPLLQIAWTRDGADAFQFCILETIEDQTPAKRKAAETAWIKACGTLNSMTVSLGGMMTMSAEARASVSQSMKLWMSENPEFAAELSEANRTRARSIEGRANMGIHTARRWKDPEQRKELQKGLLKRWEDPEERIKAGERISARWADPEYKAKASAKLRAVWQTPERRAELLTRRETRWGDPEAKARQSAKMKAAWAATPETERVKNRPKDLTEEQVKERLKAASAARWAKPGARERYKAAMQAARERKATAQ